MTVSSSTQALFAAANDIHLQSGKLLRAESGKTEVKAAGEVHLQGGIVNINTEEMANIDPPKVPEVKTPPKNPPSPTFHTPFS